MAPQDTVSGAFETIADSLTSVTRDIQCWGLIEGLIRDLLFEQEGDMRDLGWLFERGGISDRGSDIDGNPIPASAPPVNIPTWGLESKDRHAKAIFDLLWILYLARMSTVIELYAAAEKCFELCLKTFDPGWWFYDARSVPFKGLGERCVSILAEEIRSMSWGPNHLVEQLTELGRVRNEIVHGGRAIRPSAEGWESHERIFRTEVPPSMVFGFRRAVASLVSATAAKLDVNFGLDLEPYSGPPDEAQQYSRGTRPMIIWSVDDERADSWIW